MADDLRSQFLLDPDIAFLNHGSFGACPRPVFEAYQGWQRELERQPVELLSRRSTALLAEARARLAAFLGVGPETVIFFPNPTTAVNMVARSLRLQPGDEILTTDHEYGALDRTWLFMARRSGAHYLRQTVPLPVTSPADFIEAFWAGVGPRTRVIFISHLTSPTALIFPVAEICRRAREAGILTIVDGAHAPGQLPLNLAQVGADLYAGACHKWLCAPKGSAFLYARVEAQAWLEPLVISWGWGDQSIAPDLTVGESEFVRFHQWQGTRDLAAYLATPAAIDFQVRHHWDKVRTACHALAGEARARINQLTGLTPLSPDSPDWFGQMTAARLPDDVDAAALKRRLYDDFRVEVPVSQWNGRPLLRVSIQGYNTPADVERLLAGLEQLLPAVRRP